MRSPVLLVVLVVLVLLVPAPVPAARGGQDQPSRQLLALLRLVHSAEQRLRQPGGVLLVLQDLVAQYEHSWGCMNETRALLEGLAQSSPWAVQMVDSWGRLPSGVLAGSEYSLGNFDECVDVSGGPTEGRYCLAELSLGGAPSRRQPLVNAADGHEYTVLRTGRSEFYSLHCGMCVPSACSHRDLQLFLTSLLHESHHNNLQVSVHYTVLRTGRSEFYSLHCGMCVPSACSHRDLQLFLTSLFHESHHNNLQVSVHVREDMCYYHSKVQLHTRDIVFLWFIGVYFVIILIATIYSCVKKNSRKGLLGQVVLAFSVIENLAKLVSYKPSEHGLDCLFGIKFIFMTIILISHSVLFQVAGPILNEAGLDQLLVDIRNDPFKNNQLFVDGFFLTGGFLMCRLLIHELDKKKEISFSCIIFLRYFRLTPAYAVVVAFHATVFYHLGSGPLWNSRIGQERDRCLTSWWTNLLYINNYLNFDSISWYVAADTQMFLVSLWLVYLLWRWPTAGRVLIMLAIVLSVAVTFLSTLVARLDPLLMVFRPELEDITLNSYFKNVYTKTHFRATPYFVGTLLGYIVYYFQMKAVKLNRVTVCAGWVLSTTLLVASLFSVHVFYTRGYKYRVLDAASFSSLDKLGWCAGVSWLIFACATRNAGFLGRLLSSRVIAPFSRLTYSAYLVNGFIVLRDLGTTRAPAYISEFSMAEIAFSHIVMTYLAALVLTLAFESPLNAVQKTFLQGRRSSPSDEGKGEDRI